MIMLHLIITFLEGKSVSVLVSVLGGKDVRIYNLSTFIIC